MRTIVAMSPRQTAQALSITEPTARTVLERIFQKVGVSRQSELVTTAPRIKLHWVNGKNEDHAWQADSSL
jgi:DNA-binding CsgD family transcriptional regulator